MKENDYENDIFVRTQIPGHTNSMYGSLKEHNMVYNVGIISNKLANKMSYNSHIIKY